MNQGVQRKKVTVGNVHQKYTYLNVGGGPGRGGGGTALVSGNLLVVGNKCKGWGT